MSERYKLRCFILFLVSLNWNMVKRGSIKNKSEKKKKKKILGKGVLNNLINKLPLELHLPGYQYCGPGTKLEKRLARGDSGVNPLDSACKRHDIAYAENRDNISLRNKADNILAAEASKRIFASDASLGERAAAAFVTNAMKVKSKFGMGLSKNKTKKKSTKKGGGCIKKKRKCSKKKIKKVSFQKIVRAAKQAMAGSKTQSEAVKMAVKGARLAVKNSGGKSKIRMPRILPITPSINHVGGALPVLLLPALSAISALGGLIGGASGVIKAINSAKESKDQLAESARHNKMMESIALGKGLYMTPYKRTGMGLHLTPKNFQ